MDKPLIDSLVQFCAAQRETFDHDAWISHKEIYGRSIAVVAKYLSMTSWFGHEEELVCIASEIDLEVNSDAGFNNEAEAVGFDPTLFSVAVRYSSVLRQMQRGATTGL